MGRRIVCPSCNTIFDEDLLKAKSSENNCLVCGADLSGDGEPNVMGEHPGWVTWWYYGFKSNNGKTTILDDEPIDLDKHGDTVFLIKEFKAPPKSNPGGLDEAKRILRTYIPDAFAPAQEEPPISCPYCFSTEYTLMNRGYGLLTGFIGSGKVKRVCNRCKREF